MTRLIRAATGDDIRIGVLNQDGSATLTRAVTTVAAALADPAAFEAAVAAGEPAAAADVRLLAPVDHDTRVFCVAQNYTDHAREVSGTDAPPAPVVFVKPRSALVGPGEHIELAPVTQFLDYEAELAVVIGRPIGRGATPADAAAAIAAGACLNDGSARDLQPAQLGGKPVVDWFSGKSLDRSGAIGPWLQLVAGAADLADRAVRCRINGELRQDDRTTSMVFGIPALVAFVSSRLELRPGDVIATGTPGGVGAARKLPLRDGDEVQVEVEGVGVLTNTVRAVG